MARKKLTFENKISLFFIIFILFSIPFTLALLLQTTFFLSRAYEKTDPNSLNLSTTPLITTSFLAEGFVNEEYVSTIQGYVWGDPKATFKITGLPSGLVYGNCTKEFSQQRVMYLIGCDVYGTPLIDGNNMVYIQLIEGNSINLKVLPIRISPENN